jgi:PERQ amino acid-rich with GYF domain-containing protein
MQKWYEEGYFTPDLSMKRTHLDVHWTIVQDLVNQTTNGNVFLTPPLPTRPPGLDRNSPTHIHNEPLQPAPIRSLRTSTLESYITGGSIASDSPSSSFNASQFGNSSPDPSILGGNDRVHANHDPNGRIGTFGLYDHPTPAYTGHRLNGPDFNFDHAGKTQGPSLGSLVSAINPNISGHGFSNLHVTQDAWATPNHQVSTLDTPSIFPSSHVDHSHHGFSQERGFISNEGGFPNHSTSRHSGSANYDMAGSATFTSAPVQHSFASQISNFVNQHPNHTFPLRSSEPLGPQVTYPSFINNVPLSHAQSPWTIIPNAISNNDVGAMEAPQPVTAPVSCFVNSTTIQNTQPVLVS